MKETLGDIKKMTGRRNASSRVGEIITYGQNFPAIFDTRILAYTAQRCERSTAGETV